MRTTISQEQRDRVRESLADWMREDAAQIAASKRAILALKEALDLLGHQLSHANGMMDDEQLETIVTKYVKSANKIDDEMREQAAALKTMLGPEFDADLASLVFQCSVEDAIKLVHGTEDKP